MSLAEQVAGQLRERIVTGELSEGTVLPKQEDLLAEFGVSKPSLREALRILEAEGLVLVRRGKVGGAVVQSPPVDSTARGIEVALRSRRVTPDEVATALRHLEPVCARLCASRPDREEAVLPVLREAHEAGAAALDDIRRYTVETRRFHAALVETCGDQTIALLLGALERICAEASSQWADEVSTQGVAADDPISDPAYRAEAVAAHAALIELIEAGDADGAERLTREHAGSRRLPTLGA
ncbi:MAG TPA: GntR family transcriptional regulator [Iamia sp.]|nr:GntR family transcriptional regulator [Iamia sp.]